MTAGSISKGRLIAAGVFIVAGIVALVTEHPLWMMIPFAFVLARPIFSLVVYKTYLLFFVLLFLLPLSAEVNVTPDLGLDFPDEPLMMILTGLVMLVLLNNPSQVPPILIRHHLFILLLVHLWWILVTTALSTNPLLSVKLLLAKSWFIVPFVVLPSMLQWEVKKWKWVVLLLLVPMLLLVCQSLIRHAAFSFSFDGIKETLSPFFRNHVTYSGMLVCLLPLLILLFLHAKRQWKSYLLLAMTIAFAGLLFSYSRGAWLAVGVGIAAAFLIRVKRLKAAIVTLIAIVVITTGWLASNNRYLVFAHDYQSTIYHSDLRDHLEATVQLKDVSNAERFYRWIAALNMSVERPLVGFGPNTFYHHYKPYTEQQFETWVSDNPDRSTVHNYFLLTLAEQGIPGLVFFLLLYVAMLLRCQYIYHAAASRLYKHLALTIGAILAMIGWLNCWSDLIETDKIGSLFWLCLGFIFVLEEQLRP